MVGEVSVLPRWFTYRAALFSVSFLMVSVLGSTANAQNVRLVSEAARGALNEASLLRALDDTAAPQDFIAAARADYRRLLTALYAAGYYGGADFITSGGIGACKNFPPGDEWERDG